MSMTLSGNMDKELDRFDMLTNMHMAPSRIAAFFPPYQSSRFPIALDPETPFVPTEEHARTQSQSQQADSEEPIFAWLNTEDGQAAQMNGLNSPSTSRGSLRDLTAPFRAIFGPSTASNNWVVHGNRTTTGTRALPCFCNLSYCYPGFPFLCNDPHLQLMAPSLWLCTALSPCFF